MAREAMVCASPWTVVWISAMAGMCGAFDDSVVGVAFAETRQVKRALPAPRRDDTTDDPGNTDDIGSVSSTARATSHSSSLGVGGQRRGVDFGNSVGERAPTPFPPQIVPTPFVAPGSEMDCSWAVRPDGTTVLFVSSTKDTLQEVRLVMAATPQEVPTWGQPITTAKFPPFNGSRASVPRGAVVVDTTDTPTAVRFAGLVEVYPHGIAAVTARWAPGTETFIWDIPSNFTLVWAGANGGGVRNVAIELVSIASYDSHRPPTTLHDGRSGRLYAAHQSNREPGDRSVPPVKSNVTALYSDDGGTSWVQSQSHVTAPVPPGSECYGAVEPTSVQLPNGTLWLLFRTQTGRLWETSSDDAGTTLLQGRPSPFRSTDSPPLLLRLSHPRWGSAGATMLVWVNCGTSIPLSCMDSKNSVYTIRNLLHAAVSTDGGVSWKGYREIYRDPLMAAPHPVHGDTGVAYSYGVELPDGTVILKTGQGVGRWGVVRIDPGWLLETAVRADFSTTASAVGWNDPKALGTTNYVTTCLDFRHFGTPVPNPPRCTEGGVGVTLLPQPEGGTALCLSMNMFGSNTTQSTAAYNFPGAATGRATLMLRVGSAFAGANLSLADHYAPSYDLLADASAVFAVRLQPSTIPSSTWANVTLVWSVAESMCTLWVNQHPVRIIQLQPSGNVEGVVSYLRLTAVRPHSNKGQATADSTGFCVQSIVVVSG